MRFIKYPFALFITVFLVSCGEEEKPDTLFKLHPASDTGIEFENKIIETDTFNILTDEYIFNGGGVAVADFNNDGLSDLFFTGNEVANKLYLNKGNFKFNDISAGAGIEASAKWSTGVTIVDINNDALPDVYICAASTGGYERSNMLFVNQGNNADGIPTFKEMAAQYGIDDNSNSMHATFFDYDLDGDLDLYVLNDELGEGLPTNYRPKVTDGSAMSNDRFFKNNGDGTFTDATQEAGILLEGFGLGIGVGDINMDGWPDLYVSNDYVTNDLLYINQKDGTFKNDIKGRIRHQSKFSMGNDISDFNNDGFLDIVTLDMLGESSFRQKTTISDNPYIFNSLNERFDYEYQYIRNMLQMGNGPDVPYSEIGMLTGVDKTDWSWSPLFMDVDNDGQRDLLITNGFPRDITDRDFGDFRLEVSRFTPPGQILDSIPVVKIPNYAYRNTGYMDFEDVGEDWGLSIPSFSNGAVYADLDNDGDLDYVVNNINDKAFVFENTLNTKSDNHYLRVALKGPQNNAFGVGAKVVLTYQDGRTEYHEQYLSRGYMSSVDPVVHFGTGKESDIASVEVLWPDGKYVKKEGIPADQTITIAHNEARDAVVTQLKFPLVVPKQQQNFSSVSDSLKLKWMHQERDIIDFNMQRTIQHKFSQNGPCVAVGDLDGNGLEDFVIGSASRYSPVIFFQESDGTFRESELYTNTEDMTHEEESIVLFDLDNDGDLDMYLVSGSNEFMDMTTEQMDVLLINNGKGKFTAAPDRMPEVNASGSVVVAQDFDGDGFTDLFVGGRTPMGAFPTIEKSFLLKNNNGKLDDVTDSYAAALRNVGMVTDATWADVNGDNKADLIVVGELMPVTIFVNGGTRFTKMQGTGLDEYLGWWESVTASDFDGDGDLDLLAGNLGANNMYQPSKERPVTVLSKDFDNNGTIDPIYFAHLKNKDGEYESVPVHFWSTMNQQSPIFRQKFNLYKEYGNVTQQDLFTDEQLQGVTTLQGNYDRSSYIENLGDGTFKMVALPPEAQMAPMNDIAITDYNQDGNLDVLMVGNDYGNETFVGRLDASNGVVLQGDGNGNFISIPTYKSGFKASGDAKAIAKVKNKNGEEIFIVTQNGDSLLSYLPRPVKPKELEQ